MLQHSSVELAVCRETWELKVEFSPFFPLFFRPLGGGREEGRRGRLERRERVNHVTATRACACHGCMRAIGHLLVMSACALGHLLSCLARAVQVVLRC